MGFWTIHRTRLLQRCFHLIIQRFRVLSIKPAPPDSLVLPSSPNAGKRVAGERLWQHIWSLPIKKQYGISVTIMENWIFVIKVCIATSKNVKTANSLMSGPDFEISIRFKLQSFSLEFLKDNSMKTCTKNRKLYFFSYVGRLSCLHATLAFSSVNPSLHTVPQDGFP